MNYSLPSLCCGNYAAFRFPRKSDLGMTSQPTSFFVPVSQQVGKQDGDLHKSHSTLAVSGYKQLLEKHAVLLQLSSMADEEETKRRTAPFFPLSSYFIVYKYQRASPLFIVYTRSSHLWKPTWGVLRNLRLSE